MGVVGVSLLSGCAWAVVKTNDWISILYGSSGSGSGEVSYMVAANPSALGRSGVLEIGGQACTVSQAGAPCSYALNPPDRAHGPGLETGVVSVSTLSGCPWAVVKTNDWISLLSGSSGSGSGEVSYIVEANPSALGRSGVLEIGGQACTVSQAG